MLFAGEWSRISTGQGVILSAIFKPCQPSRNRNQDHGFERESRQIIQQTGDEGCSKPVQSSQGDGSQIPGSQAGVLSGFQEGSAWDLGQKANGAG